LPFPILSLGLSFLLENHFCKALLEPVISSFDFGHLLDESLLHRGDPFSHPSGSSAENKKLFRVLSSLYIKSFLVFVFFLPLTAPIPQQRDQKTFSTGSRSFSS
jgi:hypothetical protein